jgi:hypothetical protein
VNRLYAYAVSVAFLGAVAAPGLGDVNDDGYPLSTYPMFARQRARVNDVTGAFAVWKDGRRVALPPRLVANGEAMLAVATLHRALAAGRVATRALCGALAARVASTRDAELAGASRIEIVTQRVDSIDFLGGRRPSTGDAGRVRAHCAVTKATQPITDSVGTAEAR